jgi:hypothetical protein
MLIRASTTIAAAVITQGISGIVDAYYASLTQVLYYNILYCAEP